MSSQKLLQKVKYLPEEEQKSIQKAIVFIKKAHFNQKRLSGESYIIHPIAVAEILAELKLDSLSIIAGLLHDVLEDTPITFKEIEKEFGKEVANLVKGVSKLSEIKYRGQERSVENFRRMFLAVAEDFRVILIKFADRLHNMRTIKWLPQEKQKRIALETMEIFAPLANRLGMGRLKGEFEDLAFPILYPNEYNWIRNEVNKRYGERENYLRKLKPIIEKELRTEKINFIEINFRAKHLWSLYQKLQRYDMDWDKIYDLVALRIIVKTISDCYGALGVIHKLWHPLPGRIKDYIALPKPNGYQSLHTTVFAKDGVITEFQIRTEEMHRVAENGIASHWLYDEFGKNREKTFSLPKKGMFSWINQLLEWQKKLSSNTSKEFLGTLKFDFFNNRIFVFTPKGDVINLPQDATPIDFAYQIHSEIGDHCIGAKVNGKLTALSSQLKNGDIIEIITAKNKKPSADWLKFVKTYKAKDKIKQALKIK